VWAEALLDVPSVVICGLKAVGLPSEQYTRVEAWVFGAKTISANKRALARS
jgi:hypothetical protein